MKKGAINIKRRNIFILVIMHRNLKKDRSQETGDRRQKSEGKRENTEESEVEKLREIGWVNFSLYVFHFT